MGTSDDDSLKEFEQAYRQVFGPPRAPSAQEQASKRNAQALQQLLGVLMPDRSPGRRLERRRVTDSLASQFESKVIAQAIQRGLNPVTYSLAVRQLPPTGEHELDGIPLAALADAATVLECDIEINFVPKRTKVQGDLASTLASVFSQPCNDPECPCHKYSGQVSDSVDPEKPSAEDAQAMQDSLTEEMVNLAGADAPLEAAHEERTEGVES